MNPDALFRLTNGLYVLGAKDNQGYVGSLIDAVTQVAHNPLALIISCGNNSYTKECIDKIGEFSLSVLSKDIDPWVIANFGFQTSREVDKWSETEFFERNGLPYVKHNLATIRCKVVDKKEFISNTMFMAEVVEAEENLEGEPLTYRDYRSYFKLDVIKSFEEHKKKTTIVKKEKKTMSDNAEKKWVCTVCGYVYDGDVPFEELPEDWVCPLCGVDKSFFEQQDA